MIENGSHGEKVSSLFTTGETSSGRGSSRAVAEVAKAAEAA